MLTAKALSMLWPLPMKQLCSRSSVAREGDLNLDPNYGSLKRDVGVWEKEGVNCKAGWARSWGIVRVPASLACYSLTTAQTDTSTSVLGRDLRITYLSP
jgi:hypothetical protein